MLKSFLLLLLASLAFSALAQQASVRPTSFPVRHRLGSLQYSPGGLAQPLGPVAAASPRPALVPTRQAAATYAPLPASPTPPAPTEFAAALPPAPRHDLTGAQGAPAYDLYQNLPEEFRKHTLRAPYTEPLPLHLLWEALGR